MLGLANELDLEEAESSRLRSVPPQCDTLVLQNTRRKRTGSLELMAALQGLPGIERIKKLRQLGSSMLEDLRFLSALPKLEVLHLHGLQLRSLEGIDCFTDGKVLIIDTGTNRRRDIGHAGKARVELLHLSYANSGDLDTVASIRGLRHLKLIGAPLLPIAQWSELGLVYLQLWNGALQDVRDTESIESLRILTLNDCRRIEGFGGRCGNVEHLNVQGCNRVDWGTVGVFSGLRTLAIVGNNTEVAFSTFCSLEQLRSLTLVKVKVRFDTRKIASSAKGLEELSIRGLRKEELRELSILNPGVVVSSAGAHPFRDGERVK